MAHDFTSRVIWTGNIGQGTASYTSYARTWDIAVPGKPAVHCSNDPMLGGDPTKMNPEDLLLSALSACHMLWFLHYASEAGIIVTGYEDRPLGLAEHGRGGAGRFIRATLRPKITVKAPFDAEKAAELHHRIPQVCFIARSVAFPVDHAPDYVIAE